MELKITIHSYNVLCRDNVIKRIMRQRMGGCGSCKSLCYIKATWEEWHIWMQSSTLTLNKSYLPSAGGPSHWVNNDELDEIKTVHVLLSAAGFWSSYPLGPEHKAAISLTHFSCLVEYMKDWKDNEADSFGITVTMRGKHNCTPAWVSLETHYTVEMRTRTTKFPPIVITGNTKISTKCDFKWFTVARQGC